MNIKHLISSNAYWTLNKRLVKRIGSINAVVLLTDLIDKREYLSIKNEKPIDEFTSTIEQVENATTLTKFKQKKCIELLEKHGLIRCHIEGIPPKRTFIINDERLYQFLTVERQKEQKNGVSSDLSQKERNLTFNSEETFQTKGKKVENLIYKNTGNKNTHSLLAREGENSLKHLVVKQDRIEIKAKLSRGVFSIPTSFEAYVENIQLWVDFYEEVHKKYFNQYAIDAMLREVASRRITPEMFAEGVNSSIQARAAKVRYFTPFKKDTPLEAKRSIHGLGDKIDEVFSE